MMNIIKISTTFCLAFLISILIGKFKIFIFITFISLFHEIGHVLLGLIFRWPIEKILILPMGCLTVFNTKINNSYIKELLVTLAGPFFQAVLFFFIKGELYINCNFYLLLFNLLPIYPLDGYKIMNFFLYQLFPFKLANKIGVYISFIILLIIFLLRPTSIMIILILIVFSVQILKYKNDQNFIFNKFLFERYLYNINYRRNVFIKDGKKEKMFRNKKHTFLVENTLLEEKEILRKMFDKL